MSKRPQNNNVTIKDVAQEAGVSYSTVSRVINNNEHVRPEKRQRVLEAMARLNYVVNQQARSLAGGRSHMIGLLVREVGNSYAGPITRGVDEALHAANYDLMLYTTRQRKINEALYARQLANGLAEGLLLLLPKDPDAYLHSLRDQRFPYVVIDHQGFDDFSPTVVATNWQGAFDGMNYLLRLGHRRIAHITGSQQLSSGRERLAGYRAALEGAGIAYDERLVPAGDFSRQAGFAAANALLDLPDPPTAIFAANDISAYGALDAIRARGLRVPEDISLLGFDDDTDAPLVHPPLTTIRQPLIEMGRRAAQMLLQYIADPDRPVERLELPTRLVERATCAPPAVKDGS